MEHPITPPTELVQRLCDAAFLRGADGASRGEIEVWLIQQAFAAGADQELEACAQWLDFYSAASNARDLRIVRRPKPPSLKDQALEALGHLMEDEPNYKSSFDTIRRALEALPND
jgi:hypothetical protein